MNVLPFSNSAVPIERAEIEAMLHSLVAVQNVTARLSAVLLDRIDAIDGDPDLETNRLEDDFTPQPVGIDFGPGCEIADSSGDQAWVEWHTMRGSQKRGHNLLAGQEDDEEDDPAEEDDPSGQNDEDGINTAHEHGFHVFSHYGPGCPYSDPGGNDLGR